MNILMVGNMDETALEGSYKRAFETLNHTVTIFDLERHYQNHVQLGRFGQMIDQYLGVNTWMRKTNRELAVAIRAAQPDLVLVFGNTRVLFSTLAFTRSLGVGKTILIWPDPLTNLHEHVRASANLYDGVATYCAASVPVFQTMGFAKPVWVPLGGDPVLHRYTETVGKHTYDLTFVGAWRPEREHTLDCVAASFPTARIGIWGTDWKRSGSKRLRRLITPHPLRGAACSEVFGQSLLNLNVIDDTCYPAANMRFFEIPVAGGLQLASACPELADTFRHGEHILYFTDEETLCTTIENALTRPHDLHPIRQAGHALISESHTYTHRARQLLADLL